MKVLVEISEGEGSLEGAVVVLLRDPSERTVLSQASVGLPPRGSETRYDPALAAVNAAFETLARELLGERWWRGPWQGPQR